MKPKPMSDAAMRRILQKTAESIDAPNIVMTHWLLVARAIRDARDAQWAAMIGEPVAWYLPGEGGDDSIFRDRHTVAACNGNPWTGFLPLYAIKETP